MQHYYNISCVFNLFIHYSERVKRSEIATTANAATEQARLDVEIIRGLQEQVNLMHNKVDKLTEALERAQVLHKEGKQDMETV